MSADHTTGRMVDALRDHLNGRWESLSEEEADAIEFARRHLRNVMKVWRRAERDNSGIDPSMYESSMHEERCAVRVLLADKPGWRGDFNGRYVAHHYGEGFAVHVAADSLPDLVRGLEAVGDLPTTAVSAVPEDSSC